MSAPARFTLEMLATRLLISVGLVGLGNCLAVTDTITWGGDNSRAGYQTNHNLDPAIVGSSEFSHLFKTTLPGNYLGTKEQIFSQPLVYTPSDGSQYVYFATTQNNLYKLEAKTGTIVASRNLHIPFLATDLDGCVDINPTVGVIGTGVIDPETDTLYLVSKTYADQNFGPGPQGKPNGRYFIHAISVDDLTERPNFPVDLEGIAARNNPSRSFNGGIHLQRPALLHSGKYIYAGFGSHCVQYNFTGWIIGWDKLSGQIVERFATQGEGVESDIKGASVWMSGGGLASDDAGSMFFATGNGYASQLKAIPVQGHSPPSALEEAAVHMTIHEDGSLSVVDFFIPWDKQALDGADKDLGTSPLEILPGEFSCGDARRIGVVTGKSGKTYWLNLDDMGGYRNGPDRLDAVIQTYQNDNSVYAGAGVYPLEGGYIYINVVQYPSNVFKFSCDNGIPSFTKVAESPMTNSYILGVSHGTVTSLGNQPGTGLFWVVDVQNVNIRIFDAVPQDGMLNLIKSFQIPGITKFTRPVFGDGIMYVGTNQGVVYGFGSPVAPPVNCTVGDFGDVGVGNSSTKVAVCSAIIGLTVNGIELQEGADYELSGLPRFPLSLTEGNFFAFSLAFYPSNVGHISGSIIIRTTNNASGYSTEARIRTSGSGVSLDPLLELSPSTVAFGQVVTGETPKGVDSTMLIVNKGNSLLTISGVLSSNTSTKGPFVPWVSGKLQVGPFTVGPIPSAVPPASDLPIALNFNPSGSGNFSSFIKFISDGGERFLTLTGNAGPAATALLEFEAPGGGWIPYQKGVPFGFGNVTENTSRSVKLRLTNAAPKGGVRLSVTVSKPPFGVSGIIRTVNQVDLAEGVTLEPGESETATLYCSVPKAPWNSEPYDEAAVWTMNLNDLGFGKQTIQFSCTAVTEQAPPLMENGLGRYRYVGCFKENNPGRQLARQLYGNGNNTNALCIAACSEASLPYCGTQYQRECWAGPSSPTLQVDDGNCNYACAGDINQYCGGNGVAAGAGGAYISLFTDLAWQGPSGPVVNPGVEGFIHIGCYTEATQGRALPFEKLMAMRTVASCIHACAASGYLYAGLEYGGECWCGNGFGAGAVPAPDRECSMTCSDNAMEYCGGPSRLNAYKLNSSPTSTSIASSSSTLSSPPASQSGSSNSHLPPVPTSPAVKTKIGSFEFQGCYTEATGQRALADGFLPDDNMTLEMCAKFCKGHTFFGVEYGRECWCGDVLHEGSVPSLNQADCSFSCPGDPSEFCGAGNRLQLYQISDIAESTGGTSSTSPVSHPLQSSTLTSASILPTSSKPSPSTPTPPVVFPGNANFTYLGCYHEPSSGRLLRKQVLNDGENMTNALCLSTCLLYQFAGVEYGRECWCGDSLDLGGNNASTFGGRVDDGECDFKCPGKETEACGGRVRVSLYAKGEY